jgi:Cysteine rich repeat
MKEMSDACQSDVQQFCKDVSPGGGRLAQCLKQHESELSSTCKAELAQARPMR